MKLKNSYILLIAMALFLLISVGSVCASEDVTADSDVIAASDDGDIDVLENGTGGGETPGEDPVKINTNVNTYKDLYEIENDEDKNISVTVEDNESQAINVEESDLKVFEGNQSRNFKYNNSIITITDQLSVGNHTLTINFLGNVNYTNSSKIVLLQILGNRTLEAPASIISDGTTVEIPVKVFDGAKYINLTEKDKFVLNLTYTGEDGNKTSKLITEFTVEDNTIKFTENVNLIASLLTINYTDAVEPKTVAIVLSTSINATPELKINENDDKNISVTVLDGKNNPITITKNDLKVLENGTNVEFDYNNSIITVKGLGLGNHTLTINYLGNANYTNATTTTILRIFGDKKIVADSIVYTNGQIVEIPVKLFDGVDYYPLVKENFNLTLTYTNATGNVTVKQINDFDLVDDTIRFTADVKLIAASLTINNTDASEAKTVAIKIITTVNATSPIDIRDTDNKTVDVIVYDGENNPLTVTVNDLKVLENGKTIGFTYNNSVITINSLTVGNHTLTIVYNGNATYNASSTEVLFKVRGNLTLDTPESASVAKDKNVNLTVTLTDGVDPAEIKADNLTITLFYTVDGETKNRTVTPVSIEGQSIIFQVTENFTKANVIVEYAAENLLTGNTTLKMDTEVSAEDFQKGETEVKEIPIAVTGSNWGAINVTASDIQVFNNGKAVNFDYNNSVITIKDAFKAGIYNLTIKYKGNALFVESNKTVVLTVYGINASSKVNVNSTKKANIDFSIINGNDTVDINADELNITVTYKKGNDTVTIPIKDVTLNNGTLSFTLEDSNFTTATALIKYNNTEVNVTLNRIYNANITAINLVADYQEGNFTFKVVDADTGEPLANKKITVGGTKTVLLFFIAKTTMNSQISLTTDENGIATLKNINFANDGFAKFYYFDEITAKGIYTYASAGDYNITVKGSDVVGELKTTITVKQIESKVIISDFNEYYGTSKYITATVVNAKTGTKLMAVPVTFKLTNSDGKEVEYKSQSSNTKINTLYTGLEGTIKLPASHLVGGKYTFTTSVNGTGDYNKSDAKKTVTIKKIPVTINAKDVTVQYNSGTTTTIKVTKNGKAVSGVYILVRLYSTSKKYNDYLFQTNKKGQVAISASLNVGKHKMIIVTADNRYDGKQVTKTITVKKASATIKAPKVTTYYKGTKTFNIKLINSKTKKGIYDAKLNVKIIGSKKYYTYTGRTLANGQIKLALGNLKPATYKVEVKGVDTKNFAAKKVTSKLVIKKAPAKLTPKKLTAKKGAKKYFKVTVKNKKTKKVIAGVKVKIKVYTGKKYKTYTVKTNKKGIAKISTQKLKVGKHKVIVTSANKYVVAKKAKSSIKITK